MKQAKFFSYFVTINVGTVTAQHTLYKRSLAENFKQLRQCSKVKGYYSLCFLSCIDSLLKISDT